MTTTAKSGFDLYTFLSAVGIGTPTWVEADLIEEESVTDARGEITIANRASDFQLFLAGQRGVSYEFTITYKRDNATYDALRLAYDTKADIGIAVMDTDIATSAAEGTKADCQVMQFNRPRNLTEGAKIAVVLKPSAITTETPANHTVP